MSFASLSVLLAWMDGWGVGRAALFKGGGLNPVGQLWAVGYSTHDEKTAKVGREHKVLGGLGKTTLLFFC